MRQMMDNRKQALISALVEARSLLFATATALPADQRDTPCVGTWCIKDLLAHLSGWDETNQQAIQEILGGKRPSFFQFYDKDWQSYNAQLVARYRIEPFEALLAHVQASHRKLVTFLQVLPAQDMMTAKSPSD